MALGVLAHVAAEYIMNLGRTLRFYSDRYAGKLTTEVSLSVAQSLALSLISSFCSKSSCMCSERMECLRLPLWKSTSRRTSTSTAPSSPTCTASSSALVAISWMVSSRDQVSLARRKRSLGMEKRCRRTSRRLFFFVSHWLTSRSCNSGELSRLVGDDFFGLAEVGLDKEVGAKALHIPMRLFRGEPKGPAAEQPDS